MKPARRRVLSWSLVAILAVGLAVAGFVLAGRQAPPPAVRPAPAAWTKNDPVGCLGRIEPDAGVIRVSARSISGQPSIVAELRVNEGSVVKANQIVAVLNSHDQLEAAWRQAESRIGVARGRLAQVKAGAKASDLAAQQAEIARLEVELADSRTQRVRNETLYEKDVVSLAAVESKRLLEDSIRQSLNQAKARLNSLSEVRQVDVDLAQAELEAATREAERSRAEYNQSIIRAPVDGCVVKIGTWPGEEVRANGILELANTERMYVVAEVLETDIGRIRAGQRATITGDALPEAMLGTVERISRTVGRNDLLQTNPKAPTDMRIVEVRIRLDSSERAARLIHAQVTVRIE